MFSTAEDRPGDLYRDEIPMIPAPNPPLTFFLEKVKGQGGLQSAGGIGTLGLAVHKWRLYRGSRGAPRKATAWGAGPGFADTAIVLNLNPTSLRVDDFLGDPPTPGTGPVY